MLIIDCQRSLFEIFNRIRGKLVYVCVYYPIAVIGSFRIRVRQRGKRDFFFRMFMRAL